MRFFLHGAVDSEVSAALVRHKHACHALAELAAVTDSPEEAVADPAVLIPLLEKKQWNLVTTDSDFVHALYEKRVLFGGIVVLILPNEEAGADDAIDRLFERYARLSARRLYTVTPSRVKIRQLPGAVGGV